MIVLDKVLDTILSQGGIWAALFLLMCIVAAALYKDLKDAIKDKASCSERSKEELKESHARHMEDSKVAVLALERNTTSSTTRAVALESLNGSMVKLAEGFAVSVQAQEAGRDRSREQLDRLEKRIEEAAKYLQESDRRREQAVSEVLRQLYEAEKRQEIMLAAVSGRP